MMVVASRSNQAGLIAGFMLGLFAAKIYHGAPHTDGKAYELRRML